MNRLRAPFPYYGSKIRAAALIESLMGPINNLVVPFAGSLGELLGRSRPAQVETVNDLDGLVVNVWRAIKYNPERVAELCDRPVHELTLHAVHDGLVDGRTTKGQSRRSLKSGRRRTRSLAEYLRKDERNHDVALAARWVWGASCWLGSGWCKEPSRKRPALAGQGNRAHFGYGVARPRSWRARPQLSHKGHGVTTSRQLPMLSGSYTGHPAHGQGVNRGGHREALVEWMLALAERLRWTRIICGDWLRCLTPAVTTSHGLSGVSLDPTYDISLRSSRLYRKDDPDLSPAARKWAIEHGDDPLMRITLAGKWIEHDEVLAHGWTRHQWRDDGEVIWASPHCDALAATDGPLFAGVGR